MAIITNTNIALKIPKKMAIPSPDLRPNLDWGSGVGGAICADPNLIESIVNAMKQKGLEEDALLVLL